MPPTSPLTRDEKLLKTLTFTSPITPDNRDLLDSFEKHATRLGPHSRRALVMLQRVANGWFKSGEYERGRLASELLNDSCRVLIEPDSSAGKQKSKRASSKLTDVFDEENRSPNLPESHHAETWKLYLSSFLLSAQCCIQAQRFDKACDLITNLMLPALRTCPDQDVASAAAKCARDALFSCATSLASRTAGLKIDTEFFLEKSVDWSLSAMQALVLQMVAADGENEEARSTVEDALVAAHSTCTASKEKQAQLSKIRFDLGRSYMKTKSPSAGLTHLCVGARSLPQWSFAGKCAAKFNRHDLALEMFQKSFDAICLKRDAQEVQTQLIGIMECYARSRLALASSDLHWSIASRSETSLTREERDELLRLEYEVYSILLRRADAGRFVLEEFDEDEELHAYRMAWACRNDNDVEAGAKWLSSNKLVQRSFRGQFLRMTLEDVCEESWFPGFKGPASLGKRDWCFFRDWCALMGREDWFMKHVQREKSSSEASFSRLSVLSSTRAPPSPDALSLMSPENDVPGSTKSLEDFTRLLQQLLTNGLRHSHRNAPYMDVPGLMAALDALRVAGDLSSLYGAPRQARYYYERGLQLATQRNALGWIQSFQTALMVFETKCANDATEISRIPTVEGDLLASYETCLVTRELKAREEKRAASKVRRALDFLANEDDKDDEEEEATRSKPKDLRKLAESRIETSTPLDRAKLWSLMGDESVLNQSLNESKRKSNALVDDARACYEASTKASSLLGLSNEMKTTRATLRTKRVETCAFSPSRVPAWDAVLTRRCFEVWALQSLMQEEAVSAREETAFFVHNSVGVVTGNDRFLKLDAKSPARRFYDLQRSTPSSRRAEVTRLLPSNWCVTCLSLMRGVTEDVLLVSRVTKTSSHSLKMELTPVQSRRIEELNSLVHRNDETAHEADAKTVTSMSRAAKQEWWDTRDALDLALRTSLRDLQADWFPGWRAAVFAPPLTENELLETALNTLGSEANSAARWLLEATLQGYISSDDALAGLAETCPDLARETCEEVLEVLTASSSSTRGSTRRGKSSASTNSSASASATLLCVSSTLFEVPWESIPALRGKTVTRVPSIGFALELLERACRVSLTKGAFIVDPKGDLTRTTATMKPLMKKLEKECDWFGTLGQTTTCGATFLMGLQEPGVVLYCGHGAGEEWLPSKRESLSEISIQALTLLMGCSSGKKRLSGVYEANGVVDSYLASGCPMVVANLFDVTDKDIDRFTQEMTERLVFQEQEIAQVVAQSREVCKLKYLVGAAPICFGIPLRSGGGAM